MEKRGQKGLKLLTIGTSIRWFGWGLGEAFIPVFFLLFSTSFFETGLLASAYYIVFFLFLPVSSYLADNFKVKNMILGAMIIYIFIGLGYFAAGLTGAVIFIILSNSLNGVSLSLDQIGRESYFMRHSEKRKISETFGKFDFITTFWWIVAVLIGLFLVEFLDFKIHELLLFIAPTSLISFFVVLKIREKNKKRKIKFSFKKAYVSSWKELKSFNKSLKLIALLTFLFGFLSSILYFFVPISSYVEGNGLVNSAILASVYAIPFFFGRRFGRIVDKKKDKVYLFGIISLLLVLVLLSLFKNYFFLLAIMLFSSTIFELLSLTRRGMITRLGKRAHFGEIDGSISAIAVSGAVFGPVLFGFLIDLIGISYSYIIIAGLTLTSLLVFIKKRRYLKN